MRRYRARSTLNISRLDAVVALVSDQRIHRRPSLKGVSVHCVPFHCRSINVAAPCLPIESVCVTNQTRYTRGASRMEQTLLPTCPPGKVAPRAGMRPVPANIREPLHETSTSSATAPGDEMITLKAFCHECRGTGVFVGVCEPKGTGVVCLICGGHGCKAVTYTPFKKRAQRRGVTRVYLSGRVDRTDGISYAAFQRGRRP